MTLKILLQCHLSEWRFRKEHVQATTFKLYFCPFCCLSGIPEHAGIFWEGLHFIFWVRAFVCLFYMQLYYRFYGLGAGRGVLSLCLDCHLQTRLMCCPILFANILFRIFHQYSYMRLVCSFILSCLSGLKINVRLVSQEEFRSLPSSSLLPRNKRTQK